MLFNSAEFLFLFLPISLIVFYQLSRLGALRIAIAFLLVASLFFYGYWKLEYLPLLVLSILVNFFLGRAICDRPALSSTGKWLMWVGIAFNLGCLTYYKYFGFLTANLNQVLPVSLPVPDIVLPLAISFYSFTQIAYLVDAYRGQSHRYSITQYGLFVTFFPQLIAGPILRHDQLIPELESKKIFSFSTQSFCYGLTLLILGLTKKVLIADLVAPWANSIFAQAQDVSLIEAWVGALAYTLQLYFDFSGYSDMAVGLGAMFNVHIPINFNSPYKADSIADFWRRWHITLSNFLRDYLYIPLGGNRKGKLRQYMNLLVTMLLGGLWHGDGWTFILWGGLHGTYLVIHRVFMDTGIAIGKRWATALTFVSIVCGWVLFRATNMADGLALLTAMFTPSSLVLPGRLSGLLGWLSGLGVTFEGSGLATALPALPGTDGLTIILNLGILAGLLVVVFLAPNSQGIANRFQPTIKWAATLGVLAAWIALSLTEPSDFLYFQF